MTDALRSLLGHLTYLTAFSCRTSRADRNTAFRPQAFLSKSLPQLTQTLALIAPDNAAPWE
jgi:hypothetical protein